MSKTPKTCALLERLLDRDGVVEEENAPFIWVRLCKEIERDNADLLEALQEQEKAEQWIASNDPGDPFFSETTRLKLNHAADLRRAALTKAKGGNQ
jgi:hypothetical protein